MPSGNLRELLTFIGGEKDEMRKMEKIFSVRQMNRDTRKKNRERFDAAIQPGKLRMATQNARKN